MRCNIQKAASIMLKRTNRNISYLCKNVKFETFFLKITCSESESDILTYI